MLILSDNSVKFGSTVIASSESIYFPVANLQTLIASDVWRSLAPGTAETLQINLSREFQNETLYLAFNRGFDFTQLSAVEYQLGLIAGGSDAYVPITGYVEGQTFLVKIEVGATPRDYIQLKFTKTDADVSIVQLGKIYAGPGFDNAPVDNPDKGGYRHVFYESANIDYALGGQKYSEGVYQSWRGSIDIPYLPETNMAYLRAFILRVGTFFPFWILPNNYDESEGTSEEFDQIRYVTLSTPPTEVYKEFGDAGFLWALSLSLEEQL